MKDKDKDADGGDQDADAKDTYETRLPKLPSSQVLKETEPLVKSLAAMNSWFKKSPYNLGAPGDKKRQAAAMEQLASIITLDPNYFPKELWPDGQRRRGGAKGAQAANWGGPSKRHAGGDAFEFDLGRLEELARRESTQPGAAAGDAGDRSVCRPCFDFLRFLLRGDGHINCCI